VFISAIYPVTTSPSGSGSGGTQISGGGGGIERSLISN